LLIAKQLRLTIMFEIDDALHQALNICLAFRLNSVMAEI
jgi:hypothetical protein